MGQRTTETCIGTLVYQVEGKSQAHERCTQSAHFYFSMEKGFHEIEGPLLAIQCDRFEPFQPHVGSRRYGIVASYTISLTRMGMGSTLYTRAVLRAIFNFLRNFPCKAA